MMTPKLAQLLEDPWFHPVTVLSTIVCRSLATCRKGQHGSAVVALLTQPNPTCWPLRNSLKVVYDYVQLS